MNCDEVGKMMPLREWIDGGAREARTWLLGVLLILLSTTVFGATTTYSLPDALGSGVFGNCSTSSPYSCSGSINFGTDNSVVINVKGDMTLTVAGSFIAMNKFTVNSDPGRLDLVVGGNISVMNNLNVEANLSAPNGSITIMNGAYVAGDLSAGQNITIGTSANIIGNVTAGGTLIIGSGTITGTCSPAPAGMTCGAASSGVASFTVVPSTSTASTCATAAGTPPAPWVTVTAKSGTGGSGSTVTTFAGPVAILGIGSATPSIKTGNGNIAANTYTFVAADNGVAVLYLSDHTAEIITPRAVSGTATGTSSSAITFSDNVLVVSDADILIPSDQPVAGRIHKLNAAVWKKDAATGNCSVNTDIAGSINSQISITTGTSHPAGALVPTVSATNACPGAALGTSVGLTFVNGQAPLYLCSTDVGQYQVNVNAPSLPGSATSGSSSTLTVVPFAIVVSGVQQGVIPNTGATAAGGSVFAKAGSAFQATVGAYRWSAAADANNDGLPDSAALSSDAMAAGITPAYAQDVPLFAMTPITPSVLSGGTLGAWTNGVVSVTGGSHTATTLAYLEVGSFTLSAVPPAYLGVNIANRTLIYSTASTSPNAVVGRFTPDHFETTITPGCGIASTTTPFTYSGQPFSLQITAKDAGGGITKNYDGALGFAKVTTVSGVGAAGAITGGDVASPSAQFAAANFTGGKTPDLLSPAIPLKPTFTFSTTPTAATDVAIRAVDADSGTPSGAAEAINNLRSGRLRMFNAYGSELLALPMSLTAQYWNGTGYVLNGSDNCTTLPVPTAASGLGFPGPRLVATETTAALNGTTSGNATLSAGDAKLVLSRPGPGNDGSVNVTITAPAWLPGVSAANPTARATFGIYKTPVIYRREVY